VAESAPREIFGRGNSKRKSAILAQLPPDCVPQTGGMQGDADFDLRSNTAGAAVLQDQFRTVKFALLIFCASSAPRRETYCSTGAFHL
jgi:hypothetical protein